MTEYVTHRAAKMQQSRKENLAEEADAQKGWLWPIKDSPLYDEGRAGIEGRSLEFSFRPVLPRNYDRLKPYIEETLTSRQGNAIGIEIGGTGSKLFSQFTPGFFKCTAGVNLTDYRNFLLVDPTRDDERRNHHVHTGDLFEEETKAKVEAWLQGEKVDVIFERMEGGLRNFPYDESMGNTYRYLL